jgi:SAM-dependent methyltransferase
MANNADSQSWSAEQGYEARVGRWSRLVASAFLEWLALPRGGRWLDLGCGTGMLARTVLNQAAPRRVVGIDPLEGSLAHARGQVAEGRAGFLRGTAEQLPFPGDAFDAAVSGLALNFFSDEPGALREMMRVVRAKGTVAAYVWDFADGMELMRHFWDAARALAPETAARDPGARFPLCKPEPLARLFRDGGLDRVETLALDVPTVFADFDDYWLPMPIGRGSIPDCCQSLSEAQREALAARLRESLPIAADGSIRLSARAWAVRGVVAG